MPDLQESTRFHQNEFTQIRVTRVSRMGGEGQQMNSANTTSEDCNDGRGRFEQIISGALGLLLLTPFLWHYRDFKNSFWFGDEFDLLRQISDVGLWRWSVQLFSENFIPLFKIIWGSLLFIGNGNYNIMLGALWIAHALNGYLLARALFRLHFGWIAAAGTVITFGLTGITIETMTWSVQLCVVLCSTFFLLSLDAYIKRVALGKTPAVLGSELGWSAAAAWTFSRGVAAGPVLAVLRLCEDGSPRSFVQRINFSITLLIVPVLTAALIFFAASGSHHAVASGRVSLSNVGTFAGWAFGVNPIARFFLIEPSARVALFFGGIKASLMIGAVYRERGARRSWFLGLALFEIANCVLLGIGRYNPDLGLSASSRYQYSSLFTTAPFVGYWLEQLLSLLANRWARAAIVSPLLFWLGMKAFIIWGLWLPGWTAARGTPGRHLLLGDDRPPPGYDVPGIPGMENRQAQILVRHFDLH